MASLVLPYSLTNGTTANGPEVKANDDAIKSFIDTEVIQRDGTTAMTSALTLASGTPTTTQAVRRDYMESTAPFAQTWTTWTPTWSNLTLGNGATSGRYKRVGKSMVFTAYLTFGTTTVITGNLGLGSLPEGVSTGGSASSQQAVPGFASVSGYGAFALATHIPISGSGSGFIFYNATGSGNIVAGAPAAWASTSWLILGPVEIEIA